VETVSKKIEIGDNLACLLFIIVIWTGLVVMVVFS